MRAQSPQRTRGRPRIGVLPLLCVALLLPTIPSPVQAQGVVGREAALGLRFEELRFEPPRVQERTLDSGITVFLMEDRSLPLVTVYARFRGGYSLLPREHYAAAFALSGLLRSGGTTGLSPDSVDSLLDFYALQLTLGGGGENTFSSVNTLTRHLDQGLDLWSDILRNPGFDSLEVEVWRDRQLEGARRRGDDPGLLAVTEFNHIMFGDHPVGWELAEEDLSPERFNREALEEVHSRIVCPENLILGVAGDVRWPEISPLLDRMTDGWTPCTEPLLEPREPKLREGPSVFLIPKELTQSTVVVAQPGGVSQSGGEDYFASRIGNSILGGSGFSSRLTSQIRTEMGLAYGVSSFWTTPSRFEGIVGATTQTKSESTVGATQLILDIIGEMVEATPTEEEVDRIISQIVNSFVFNFQNPSQIVSRQMFYRAQGLPEDWLERYVRGIQRVDPESIRSVFQRHVDPGAMVILIVGDPDRFDLSPEVLGEVQIWEVEGVGDLSEPPHGARRSHH